MPQYPNRQFLEFEKPIKELFEQIEDTKKLQEKNPKIDYSKTLAQLEASIIEKRNTLIGFIPLINITSNNNYADTPILFSFPSNKNAPVFLKRHHRYCSRQKSKSLWPNRYRCLL